MEGANVYTPSFEIPFQSTLIYVISNFMLMVSLKIQLPSHTHMRTEVAIRQVKNKMIINLNTFQAMLVGMV